MNAHKKQKVAQKPWHTPLAQDQLHIKQNLALASSQGPAAEGECISDCSWEAAAFSQY